MPIQTNFALETAFFHVPIPATKAQVRRLNAIWNRQPPKNGRITARHTAPGLILTVIKPVVLLAVADGYWRELGRLVKRTGEPWWEFCAIIVDSEPQKKKPHAHALSLYRITAKGEMHYLHSDTPEDSGPSNTRPNASSARRLNRPRSCSRNGNSPRTSSASSAARAICRSEKAWGLVDLLRAYPDISFN